VGINGLICSFLIKIYQDLTSKKERKKGGKKRVNTCNSKSLYYAILQTHVIGNILAGNTYKAVLGNILVEITVFPGQCDQCKTHKIGISMQQ
jgi:hypothetical protein